MVDSAHIISIPTAAGGAVPFQALISYWIRNKERLYSIGSFPVRHIYVSTLLHALYPQSPPQPWEFHLRAQAQGQIAGLNCGRVRRALIQGLFLTCTKKCIHYPQSILINCVWAL
jgi:hypothetical protein